MTTGYQIHPNHTSYCPIFKMIPHKSNNETTEIYFEAVINMKKYTQKTKNHPDDFDHIHRV